MYLGMDIFFTDEGNVKARMVKYLEGVIESSS